ncbi:MAG: ATP-binding protein [Vulcanisaeta sp.]|jgi:energy-coupling factor transporter ATP-binding protein EcfA2|uniref:ATP-binding protein n=1 Tax=Vulcanisaeta sp. TaxID=2020871 RepID=UPI003D098C0E
MSSSSLNLLKVSNKLIIGLRIKKELDAWDLVQVLNGLRITVIKDEVSSIILHTPTHIPLFTGIHRDRIGHLLNKWVDYVEPLPSGITLSVIDNVSMSFSEVKVKAIPEVQVSTPTIITMCKLGDNQVRYSLFLRGSTHGKTDILSCNNKAFLPQLRDNIDLALKPSPKPGHMFMTKHYPIDIDLTRHLIVLGATGSGKTTLVKILINNALQKGMFNKIVIFDPTGEYSLYLMGRGYVAIPGIDIAVNPLTLPRHRASELLAMAIQAAAFLYGENDNGGFSFIQLEVLEKAFERLGDRNTLRDLYIALNDLEQELRRNDYLNAISAVRRRLRKVMVTALMRNVLSTSAIQSRLLVINMAPLYFVSQITAIIFTLTFLEVLSGMLNNSLIVIDEAHRILNRYVVGESIIERLIREGRHDSTTLVLVTQNPLDVKRNVLDIVGHYVVFKLNGKSAVEAADLLGIDKDIVIKLKSLEFYYHSNDITVKAYIMGNPGINYLVASGIIYRRLLENVNDQDYVNSMIKKFGRSLSPVLIPQVIELGRRLGYDVKSIIQLAAKKDPEYFRLLSRVITGEE